VLALLFGTIALFAVWARTGSKYRGAALAVYVLAAAATLPAVLMPLGYCSPFVPAKGDYQVLGGRIDKPVAIYVMLADGPDAPSCYVLPYSDMEAEAMQKAINEGGNVSARVNAEGGVQYEGEPPVTEDANKRPDVPLYGG
jgi:hypothetical protein